MLTRLQSSLGGQAAPGPVGRVAPWYRRPSPLVVALAGGLLCCGLALAFAAWLLASTYAIVLRSGLPGGQDGPMDAYRHTLASAQLAFVIGPGAVQPLTELTERHPEREKDDAMDAHNNHLGAAIGAGAGSLKELRAEVLHRVQSGGVNRTDPRQVTWLPRSYWSEGLL